MRPLQCTATVNWLRQAYILARNPKLGQAMLLYKNFCRTRDVTQAKKESSAELELTADIDDDDCMDQM